jgi:hypothetical protein
MHPASGPSQPLPLSLQLLRDRGFLLQSCPCGASSKLAMMRTARA